MSLEPIKTFFLKPRAALPGRCAIMVDSSQLAVAYVLNPSQPHLQLSGHLTGQTFEAQALALANYVHQQGLNGVNTTLVLSADDYQLLSVSALPVEKKELAAALRWRVKDMINFPVEDLVLDYFEIPGHSISQAGSLYVIAAKLSKLQKKVELIAMSGLTIDSIDVPELALRNMTHLVPEEKMGVAFMNVFADECSLLIARENNLYLTRNIDVSLTLVFEELASGVNEFSANVVRTLENLTLEIQRTLDYYQSQLHQLAPAKLLLNTQYIVLGDYFAKNLAIPVALLNMRDYLTINDGISSAELLKNLTVISGALRKEAASESAN